MSLDLSRSQASSLTAELKDEGSYDATYTINGFVLGIGGNSTFSFGIPFALNNVITMIRLQISGASSPIGNFWYPLTGELVVYDFPSSYALYFSTVGAVSGRQLNVQVINETVGSTVTIPTLNIAVHARFYSYPWA